MKYFKILISAAFASTSFSEELSGMSQEKIEAMPHSAHEITIPLLVEASNLAGVGVFVNVPSPTNPVVDIAVQQWWTPNPGTNDMLRIHRIRGDETNWIFPVNEPVVFFAIAASNAFANANAVEKTGVCAELEKMEQEQWVFKHADRSWFRVSRDNGLMYDFTTNLWQHARVSPNLANRYEVLRNAVSAAYDALLTENPLELLQSWRLASDSIDGLEHIIENGTEVFLAEITTDPLSPEWMLRMARKELECRFAWHEDANGVLRAPDIAALIASSNFTAQALAAWRTHDTNSIISFAQNALATNATPEAMLFRGAAAYYLENDWTNATNLIYSANRILQKSRAYTVSQKSKFLDLDIVFHPALRDYEHLRSVHDSSYIGRMSLETFWEEHASKADIFKRFGGEFPFNNMLEIMYDKNLIIPNPWKGF